MSQEEELLCSVIVESYGYELISKSESLAVDDDGQLCRMITLKALNLQNSEEVSITFSVEME